MKERELELKLARAEKEIEFLKTDNEWKDFLISREREGFNLLEKAVDEHEGAKKIFKRYSELRATESGK